MASYDSSVANSSGYFRDPATKQLLTGEEPRVIQCAISDTGKFIWPQIMFSNGEVGKIVYKIWTDEEKAIYKKYRTGSDAPPKPAKPKPEKVEAAKPASTRCFMEDTYHDPANDSVLSGTTLDYITKCNEYHGKWVFEGVLYDAIGIAGSNKWTPIARSLIPAEHKQRLGIK